MIKQTNKRKRPKSSRNKKTKTYIKKKITATSKFGKPFQTPRLCCSHYKDQYNAGRKCYLCGNPLCDDLRYLRCNSCRDYKKNKAGNESQIRLRKGIRKQKRRKNPLAKYLKKPRRWTINT